ncbi:MAG TPA: methyltransferase domain-containing protein [Saprospiraceae bacterium]|nr:methyltransferase domain-containing protein [Saprospiraceae bacterium]
MLKNCLIALFSLGLALFLSCKQQDSSKENGQNAKHPTHDANAHMHQSSTEELIRRFSNPQRDEWQQPIEVLETMVLDSSMAVMDIGTGSGYFSLRLAPMVKKLIAADVEEAFLMHVQKMADSLYLSNIDTMLIPMDGPEHVKTPLDRILIVNTYHHISDRVSYFKKLRKWINEKGILYIVDFRKNINGPDVPGPPKEHKLNHQLVSEELERASWKNIQVDTMTLPYQYIIRAE